MTDQTTNYTELAKEFARATDNVKEVAEEIKGKMANGEKLSQTAIEKADEALVTMNEIKLRIDDLEQKSARRGSDELAYQSVGQKFAESEQFKRLQADPRGVKNAKIELKANITSATTDADGSAGALVNPHRVDGVVTPPNRRLTVRDLLMDGTTDSNAITYVRETGFTNNANAQAGEGEKKAQSDIKYDDVITNVATIAHFFKTSRQILDDAPQLASQIDGRLLYGLKLKEELQILNGDGTSGRLKGIIPQATAFADKASLEKYTIIDQLRLAQLHSYTA